MAKNETVSLDAIILAAKILATNRVIKQIKEWQEWQLVPNKPRMIMVEDKKLNKFLKSLKV